jgi:hypothetical protein
VGEELGRVTASAARCPLRRRLPASFYSFVLFFCGPIFLSFPHMVKNGAAAAVTRRRRGKGLTDYDVLLEFKEPFRVLDEL